ncbi:MipA/OmpV family protein [Marinobacter sp. M216]|uniref:MipA/OmpV family protein n=1 Tax=Marinobacter albus TaxID=3030833 RepID=A0ABT7HEE7_9GAMM|nr:MULTISPECIES: MipA/OmpV family protein [unclassified Marinobacter]MBW7469501.1 MipA/OmpV family protein [Marinobacter sp. F4218]MDK9558230.1 MipA/OmpV family protein [Marinobacter sp. M216]
MKIPRVALSSLFFLMLLSATALHAADLSVQVRNLPADGTLVLQVYDDPDAFGDFRNPRQEVRYSIQPGESYVLPDVPTGKIAVLAYLDENDNGALDKNFIGIPREPVGLSNNYQPKGPPSFRNAAFTVREEETATLDIELYRVLGEFGQWGVGLGVIGRGSPYVGSDSNVLQPIPAITYFGERLQWVGPNLRYGIVGSEELRLAVTASYRIGAYEEDDSEFLRGLGDRDSTLMAGLGLVYEAPYGLEIDLGYEHDALDQIGGGAAMARVSRGFQFGNLRLSPELGVNWLSSKLANHDFGVPTSAAIPGRPAYDVGNTVTYEVGVGAFYELTESWRVVVRLAMEELGSDITNSPIVEDERLFKGFGAVTYSF